MKTKSLLLLFPLLLLSCVSILKNTVGRVILTKSEKEFVFKKNTQVEFDYEIDNGLIVLKMSINNVDSLRFILDSGAKTCLSEKSAIILGGTLTSGSNTSKDNNSVQVKSKIYFFDSLVFNCLKLKNLKIRSFVNLPLNVDGIIGSDFMADKIVSINAKNKKITFTTRKNDYKNSHVIKISKGWDGRYYINAKIENRNYKLLFDTGHTGWISIQDSLTLESQKKASYITKSINMHSYNFKVVDYYDIPTIEIGGYYLENDVIRLTKTIGLKKDYGLLGFNFFHNQDVVFDFIKKRIFFEMLNTESKINYFPPINFYVKDGLRILNIEPSIFNETGIRPDDQVYSINKFRIPSSNDEINDFFLKKEYHIYKDSLELEILRGDSSFVKKIKWEYIN